MEVVGGVFMDKKIFLIMILVMLIIIPSVSAIEWDNVKSYNSETKEITVDNFFGLPVFSTTIAKIKLNTPEINYVPRGYGKVAEVELTLYNDYEQSFKELELYNLKNGGKKFEKDYDYKYLEYEEVNVIDYEKQCTEKIDAKNNSKYQECKTVEVGFHKEQKEKWKDLADYNFKKEEHLIIGIFTDVKEGEMVEWIPNMFGVRINEWATWQESYSVGLVGYWDFDDYDTNTMYVDKLSGQYNLTCPTGCDTTSGKIGNATNVTTGKYPQTTVDSTALGGDGSDTISINCWVYKYGGITYAPIVQVNGTSSKLILFASRGDNTVTFEAGGTGLKPATEQMLTGSWQMITTTITAGEVAHYYNATPKGTGSGASWGATDQVLVFGFTAGANGLDAELDECGIWNRTLSQEEITALYNGGDGISINTIPLTPTIQLISPTNNSNTTVTIDDFSFNITYNSDDWINYTFNVWDSGDNLIKNNVVVNGTPDPDCSVTGGDTTYSDFECIGQGITTDGEYQWNVYGCNSDDLCAWATANYTVTKDTVPPTISIGNLTNLVTTSLPINSTNNITSSDTHLETCWFHTSENSTNSTVTCNSYFNVSWNTGGTKIIYAYVNDTFGNTNLTSGSFDVFYFIINQSGSATTGEGVSETFTLLVNSTSSAIGNADANLWYNGVNKGVTTKTAVGTDAYYFTKTFTIPSGSGNSTGKSVDWYWNYNTTELTTRNTTTQNQTVYNVSITDCALVSGKVILNMSLKDEELNSFVNLTSPNTANIEVDLEISSLVNSSLIWEFSKQWLNNDSVAVCVPNGLLNLTTYRIDFVIGYDATDKVREFYYMDNGTLDNTTYFNSYTDNTINLLDLASADSTTFLFEFTDADNQEIDDIIVHTYRKYIGEGLYREVERSKQDNSGQTHIHLVEEDVIYYFMITQYGIIQFTSDNYNAKCLSSPCEISLSASSTIQNWSVIDNEGGQYAVSVNQATRIVTTTFSLDTIALVNSTVYGFYNGSATYINGSSLTSSGGTINLHIPLTYDNSTFFIVIYNNNNVIKSQWISLKESGRDYFGTFGAILGGLIVLSLMLMAVSEGAGFIVFTILALIIVGIMQLVDLSWLAIISIVCAGGIILWKLINRRGSRQ